MLDQSAHSLSQARVISLPFNALHAEKVTAPEFQFIRFDGRVLFFREGLFVVVKFVVYSCVRLVADVCVSCCTLSTRLVAYNRPFIMTHVIMLLQKN